jgi:hypothetical protein
MPMLVPDLSASMLGEPTPNIMAVVGAWALRDAAWGKSGKAGPNANTTATIRCSGSAGNGEGVLPFR